MALSDAVTRAPIRQRLTVRGVVQGVGFRPRVYTLARRNGLTGFVGNDSAGVFIEVEGSPEALAAFRRDLLADAPPLAQITGIDSVTLPAQGTAAFAIVASTPGNGRTLITPDVAICDDCLRELHDRNDRRYRYPFINCTQCGPRYTIIEALPYDRSATTMAGFPLCPACRAEYENPSDRRFHAEPTACPVCGPTLWLEARSGDGWQRGEQDPLTDAQRRLAAGQIVAIKGLGGFHLACNAASTPALTSLRARKGRPDKPFAVMARNLTAVRRFAHVSPAEAALLGGRERPIVLLRKRAGSEDRLSPLVAPGNAHIGVMLPYTPLHVLLFDALNVPALVMTSANVGGEPIVADNDEARTHLAALADALLLHNRPIAMRCDDSVARVLADGERPLPLRLARGYAPLSLPVAADLPPTLAVGGDIKSALCLLDDGGRATLGQHIGDMGSWETQAAFGAAVERLRRLVRVDPEIVACDMHPGYLSTQWAQRYAGALNGSRPVAVQHHHAHIAAVLGEQRLPPDRPVIGFAFDGSGYGPDGSVWGGELLIADCRSYERAYHLRPVPLAGGDAAVERPYRMALAHLWQAGIAWDASLPCVAACPPHELALLQQQFERGFNTVPTSSIGRLFDAVASLTGVRQTVSYEGQAAIELEALALSGPAEHVTRRYQFAVDDDSFDAAPLIYALVADLHHGVPATEIAAGFHNALAHLIVTLADRVRQMTGLNAVALSGGVFQNATLLTQATRLLAADRFTVYTHRQVPPNDGGLALGQALIAAHRNNAHP